MGENGAIKYAAKAARVHWRVLYIKCNTKSPGHKAEQGWLIDACKELFDVAKIKILPGGAGVDAGWNPGDQPSDIVQLELSRSAVLGIKHAVIAALKGDGQSPPANNANRQDLLNAVAEIGPDGILKRMIEAETKLPDVEIDETKELGDLVPKEEKK